MFLFDVAEFGAKQINVRAYTKFIGGKIVPVKGAKRTVMAIREALNDLRKMSNDAHEGAYLMNPLTGKVGQYVKGEETSVNSFKNVFKGQTRTKKFNYDDDYRNAEDNIRRNRYVLHNHPDVTSLSGSDVFGNKKKAIFAITRNSDIFRSKTKWDSKLGKSNLNSVPAYMLVDLHNEIVSNNIRTFRNWNRNLTDADAKFLGSHVTNLIFRNNGNIHYRVYLSDYSKRLINDNKRMMDYILEGDVNKYADKFFNKNITKSKRKI